jgi:Xaa-Pro aminopeptidase
MKSDMERLMSERGLDALIVPVHEVYNPMLDYLVGGVKITHGMAIKLFGQAPVIVANIMEVDEAAATGYQVYSTTDMGYIDVLQAVNNDYKQAEIAFIPHCLAKLGLAGGRVGFYGVGSLNRIIAQVDALRADYPQYTFVGEAGLTLFTEAAITKDAEEIARLMRVAQDTNAVMEEAWNFIASHRADGDSVVDADGKPLTIGDVRRFVLLALMGRGLEDTGMIFAQGRDAGVPHSRGQDDMALKLGQTIVFDLFPREIGGGYHHDMTRTWCIGYAPEHIQNAYDQVMTALDIGVEAVGVNKPTHTPQDLVLDYFESLGHPTGRSHAGTQNGYVHSLGHGIGLEIHESPSMSHLRRDELFQVGNVITIEPGLYYPDEGYGIRVEDAYYIAEDGSLVNMTPFKKDLVLPLLG